MASRMWLVVVSAGRVEERDRERPAMSSWVRCRPDGFHDIVCDRCGPVAYQIRDYRAALRTASEHRNTCNHDDD